MNIYREGIIDGIKTEQEIPNPLSVWSDFPKWSPLIKGNTLGMFIVEVEISSSPNHYHVAVFLNGEFRENNSRRVLKNVIRWKSIQ